MDKDRIDIALEIDLIVEKEVHTIVAETEGIIRMVTIMVTEVTDPEIGYNDRSSHRRENFNQDYGQRNRSVSREHDRSRPRYRSTSRDNSGNRYRNNQSRGRDKGKRSRTNSRDRGDRSGSRSSSCISTNRDRSRCYRCNEYDHFARDYPNIMLDEEQDAVLQLLAQEEQVEALNYSEKCDLNL